MKKCKTDVLVTGFALFSMFFGAGNIIFPPYLGMGAGNEWFTGFIAYYLADIGLAVLAIFALLKTDGQASGITGRAGKAMGAAMLTAIVLCLGPLIAVPRTGATTYEMFVIPVFGRTGPVIPTFLFFAVVLALTLRESSVIDIIGKILTPALVAGLLLLILKGALTPVGPISSAAQLENVVVEGVNSGYQTMDALGALLFGIIIIKTVTEKGYSDVPSRFKMVRNSSLLAAFWLLVVYCGLTYLGATASSLFALTVDRAQLIISVTQQLMGRFGVVVLGIVVTLACMTTAVALISAAAEYFCGLTGGRLPYKAATALFCLISALISNFGIDAIVAVAQPILNLVYPAALTLIVLTLFSNWIANANVYRGATLGALAVSLCEILNRFGLPFGFVTSLPLASLGFAWVLPAALCGAIGHFIKIPKIRD